MPQPTPFTITESFATDEANGVSGRSTVKTSALDAMVAAIKVTLDAILVNIALIQRDDGKLRDLAVDTFNLSASVLTLIGSGGFHAKGQWLTATAYVVGDMVTNTTGTYVCGVAHNSGVFATDLAAKKWLTIFDSSSYVASGITFTPTGSIAATNVQNAIAEVASESLQLSAVSAFVQTLLNNADSNTFLTTLTATRAEAGAVARPLLDKVRDVVCVKDFKATGAADYQAASAAAVATGAHVYYPNGTFTHTANIAVSTAGQRIYGCGDQSVIQQSGLAFDVFTPAADDISFDSLRFNGAATTQSNTLYGAIVTDPVANPQRLKVRKCKFSGAVAGEGFRMAIKFNAGSNYGVVDDCDIERLWGSTLDCGYGVLAGNVIGLHVTNTRGIGSVNRGRHLVYFSAGASDCLAAFNFATLFNEAGISQYSQAAQPQCKRNMYVSNTLTSCCQNATAAAGAIQINGHTLDAYLEGNHVFSSGSNGIAVDGTGVVDNQNTQIKGGFVINSWFTGIVLNSCVGGMLAGVTIRESSQAVANTYSNIQVLSDGVTASSDILFVGIHSTGTTRARSPIQFNATVPVPTGCKLSACHMPMCSLAGPEIGAGISVQIDGRIQTTPAYGVNIAMTAPGDAYTAAMIVATNNVGFTVGNTGITAFDTGKHLVIRIKNTSGGALGALVFAAEYKIGAVWAQPANGFSRSIHFECDGTNWVEVGRTAADVAN